MTTNQRRTATVSILTLTAIALIAAGVSWPYWAAFGVITTATAVELIRARHA